MGWDRGPHRLGFLAANPVCAQVQDTEVHLSTFGEAGANIDAPTMIPYHWLGPVGDTCGSHIGY